MFTSLLGTAWRCNSLCLSGFTEYDNRSSIRTYYHRQPRTSYIRHHPSSALLLYLCFSCARQDKIKVLAEGITSLADGEEPLSKCNSRLEVQEGLVLKQVQYSTVRRSTLKRCPTRATERERGGGEEAERDRSKRSGLLLGHGRKHDSEYVRKVHTQYTHALLRCCRCCFLLLDYIPDRSAADRVRVEAGLPPPDRLPRDTVGQRPAAQGGQGSRALERMLA